MAADRTWSGDVSADRARRFHVVNLGGAGMSAIATVLAQMGHSVSGVDANETPFLAPLRSLGVEAHVGGQTPEVTLAAGIDAVITSTATPPDHPDVTWAHGRGVPVVHRADALAAICRERAVIAVAGTHGKSTTSAMLATIMQGTETGAGYLVGTRILGLGSNASWEDGPDFVVEADESDGTFLRVDAHHAIVTNLEEDHLAHWGTRQALFGAFEDFVAAVPGQTVLCLDDAGSAALVTHARTPVTYGTTPGADHHLSDVAAEGLGVGYTHRHGGRSARVLVPFAPGIHNARNAAAAIAAAMAAGVGFDDAVAAIAAFAGVARRFELRGEVDGITFIDSYDHLPTEVGAALAAAASGPFERVVCVFQPHRYTRTRDLAHTFADAFVDADVLAITELYAAGEAPIEGVTGRLVLDAVTAAHPDRPVEFLADLTRVAAWLAETLRPGDCCLTLNAGDLTRVPDEVIAARRAGDVDR